MRQTFVVVMASMLLVGCAATERNFNKAMQVFKNNQKRGNDALVRFFGPAELDGTDAYKDTPPEPRYCYRAASDILCYREPQPGQESRLVSTNPPNIAERYQPSTVRETVPAAVPLVMSRSLEAPAVPTVIPDKNVTQKANTAGNMAISQTDDDEEKPSTPKTLLKRF